MRSRCSDGSPPTEPRSGAERGITLMEISVVLVLASLVMLALLGFYINSQATWTDASSQAIAQRELTTVVERLRDQAHLAAHAEIVDSPDAQHQQITFYDAGGTAFYSMDWDPTDSLLHETLQAFPALHPPIVSSRVTAFRLSRTAADSLVTLEDLSLKTATGTTVTISSAMALLNAVHP